MQRKCRVHSVRPVPTESQQTYHCIVCKEQYVEPIQEPWISCNICEDWSHEQCTDYAGYGPYICGLVPQQQPGSYQGGEMMMMKSVFWWRKLIFVTTVENAIRLYK